MFFHLKCSILCIKLIKNKCFYFNNTNFILGKHYNEVLTAMDRLMEI